MEYEKMDVRKFLCLTRNSYVEEGGLSPFSTPIRLNQKKNLEIGKLPNGSKNTINNIDESDVLRENLLLFFPFKDSDSNGNIIYDKSGNNIDGIFDNTPTFDVDHLGRDNCAINLNGSNDAIDLGIEKPNDLTGDLTICCWINLDSYGGSLFGTIMSNGKLLFCMSGYDYTLRFRSNGLEDYHEARSDPVPTETWMFISVTRTSAGDVNFYVNCSPSGSKNQPSGEPHSFSEHVYVGNRASKNYGVDGRIANFVVYSGILEIDEMQQVMAAENKFFALEPYADKTVKHQHEIVIDNIQDGNDYGRVKNTGLTNGLVSKIGNETSDITASSIMGKVQLLTDDGGLDFDNIIGAHRPDNNAQVNPTDEEIVASINNEGGLSEIDGSLDNIRDGNEYKKISKDEKDNLEIGKLPNGSNNIADNINVIDIPTESLIGFWTLAKTDSSGNTILDRSSNANNGTSANTPIVFGKDHLGNDDRAMVFNGSDDEINLGEGIPSDLTGDITVGCWICPTSWGEGNEAGKILDNNRFKLHINIALHRLYVSSDGYIYAFSAENSITLNVWQHIMVTRYANGTTYIYINGELNGSDYYSGDPSNVDIKDTYIGNNYTGDRTFDGRIESIAVYNKILGRDERYKLMNGTFSQLQSEFNEKVSNYRKINGKDLSQDQELSQDDVSNGGTYGRVKNTELEDGQVSRISDGTYTVTVENAKDAFNHSEMTSGNPHSVNKSDVGLGNVVDGADITAENQSARTASLSNHNADSLEPSGERQWAGRAGANLIKYGNVYRVMSDGNGDFTTLSAAYGEITDASDSNRYLIEVYGKITETSTINTISHVDVIGYSAVIEVAIDGSGYALDAFSRTNSLWKNIKILRTGNIGDNNNVRCVRIYGETDDSVKFENCSFLNETTSSGSGGASCYSLFVGGQSNPIFERCTFIGGQGGINCNGITTTSNSLPKFINCTITGGSGGNNCHGLKIEELSSPTVLNCSITGGFGGTGCVGVYSHNVSLPLISNCIIHNIHKTNLEWSWDSSNNGRFRPFSGKPYQVIGMFINVSNLITSFYLDIGTSAYGHDIVDNLEITSLGGYYITINRKQLAADSYMYASPSSVVPNDDFKIYYVVVDNYSGCNALRIADKTSQIIDSCNCISNGASDCINIATSNNNYRISNCYAETMDEEDTQYAIYRGSSISDAPIYKCNFVGKIDADIVFDLQRKIPVVQDEVADGFGLITDEERAKLALINVTEQINLDELIIQ